MQRVQRLPLRQRDLNLVQRIGPPFVAQPCQRQCVLLSTASQPSNILTQGCLHNPNKGQPDCHQQGEVVHANGRMQQARAHVQLCASLQGLQASTLAVLEPGSPAHLSPSGDCSQSPAALDAAAASSATVAASGAGGGAATSFSFTISVAALASRLRSAPVSASSLMMPCRRHAVSEGGVCSRLVRELSHDSERLCSMHGKHPCRTRTGLRAR